MRPIKWNYDTCYKLALECKKRYEMSKKSSRAYMIALQNGWIDDYTWFMTKEETNHLNGSKPKWTFEKCKEEALKYKTLKDFRENSPASYVARKRGWIEQFTWLERSETPFTAKKDNVYAYLFTDLSSVYVGRTVEPEKRDLAHRSHGTVFKFSEEHNAPIPQMTILESGLTLTEGLEREDFYRNKYEQEGWNIINIAKTGVKSGSLGSLGRKWTYKACFEEAKKYTTAKEFRELASSVYTISLKNGWYKDYTWLKNEYHLHGYWSYETCFEEAKKYTTRTQFSIESNRAYQVALDNNWIDDYTWFSTPPNKPLSYDYCYNKAKNYTSLAEFRKNEDSVYQTSLKRGWSKDYTWLKRGDEPVIILQYSYDGRLIKRYRGLKEAQKETGIDKSGISACCKGKSAFCNGYFWFYEGNESEINEKVKTVIFKYNSEYKFVKAYISLNSAVEDSDLSYQTIQHKYIDTGKLAPDGHYYYHGPHKFTDDEQK